MEAALTIVAKYVPAIGITPSDLPATIQSSDVSIPFEMIMPITASITMKRMTTIR